MLRDVGDDKMIPELAGKVSRFKLRPMTAGIAPNQ